MDEKTNFIYNEHIGEFVDVQGVNIRFTAMGDGDPVLFIHGIGQTAYTFRRNLPEFAKYFLAIAPDMVGYGFSDKPDLSYSIEENSEFILALLNALRIKQTHIVAVGSGAIYALDFMIHYPERVGRGVMVAPGGMTRNFPYWVRALNGALAPAASAMLTRKVVAETLSACFFDQTVIRPEDVETYFTSLDSKLAKNILVRSIQNFSEEEVLARLKTLQHDTLFVWGEDDKVRPMEEYARNYFGIPPHAQELVVRNTGHLVHEEKPAKFNAAAIDFLASYEA